MATNPPDVLDTSATRERLLKKIRNLQRRPDSYAAQERQSALHYIEQQLKGPEPVCRQEPHVTFLEQSKRLFTTIDHVATFNDVPQAVMSYLQRENLGSHVTVWPKLSGLPWNTTALICKFDAPIGSDMVGVSGTVGAIAETGTLVMASGPDTPASTHLLPETHIAVLERSRIVHTMEDAFALVKSELGRMPRALNLVSGPSRTADIEQTIVLGAHGPYRVHVIIVDQPVV